MTIMLQFWAVQHFCACFVILICTTICDVRGVVVVDDHPVYNLSSLSSGVVSGRLDLQLAYSPYIVKQNIVIEKNGILRIPSGVELRFAENKGITVYGTLIAQADEAEKIRFTRIDYPSSYGFPHHRSNSSSVISSSAVHWPDIRLVDGDVPSEGRVQIRYQNKWYSVCTNSKNWTQHDINVVCREMGFDGGRWHQWYLRRNNSHQMMYEAIGCKGNEVNLKDCDHWSDKRVGSGICDYHPDIGIQCNRKLHDAVSYWAGIRFIDAQHTVNNLDVQYTEKKSKSILENVVISYAGKDIGGRAVPALYAVGVPPRMKRVEVKWSAFTGLNLTNPNAGVTIEDSIFDENRGYGIFVNTSYGGVQLKGVRIRNNGADGVRFVLHRGIGVGDSFATAANLGTEQSYPVQITHQQTADQNSISRLCRNYKLSSILKARGYLLTVHFPYLMSAEFYGDEENRKFSRNGYIEVADGVQVLTKFEVQNNTRPQSLTSRTETLKICYYPAVYRKLTFSLIISADFGKTYDLNITDCTVHSNNGRGVWVENQRAGTVVNRSSIAENAFVAGIHIASGTGDVIVNQTRVFNNIGDGVNITLAAGYKHIDRSQIVGNKGQGISIWYNETSNYLSVVNENHVTYSEIEGNLGVGLLIGNVCRSDSNWNISMNTFRNNYDDAIVYHSCWDPSYSKRAQLKITHNDFLSGHRLGIKIAPALHLNECLIEHNTFKEHQRGTLYINNWQYIQDDSRYKDTKTLIRVRENRFLNNRGRFIVSVGLQEYNYEQKLFFKKNILRDNIVKEPFEYLSPRSRVAAVLVVSSSNCRINQNNLVNPASSYEIGSHLDNHDRTIDATRNFFGEFEGGQVLQQIYQRIFDRKNRYNLAQIKFIRYRTHELVFDNEDYLSNEKEKERDKFSPFIRGPNKDIIGGEMAAEILHLSAKNYRVTEDILVKPGSRLVIEAGTVLNFDQSIGMMIQGHLEFNSRDLDSDRIKFTYSRSTAPRESGESIPKIFRSPTIENISVPISPNELNWEKNRTVRQIIGLPSTIRLSHSNYGKLEVNVDGKWGSVCSYGFDIVDASIACQQLGMVLNARDWIIKDSESEDTPILKNVILSNVQCTELDNDLTTCRSERRTDHDFENSCISEVSIKCYQASWSGLRFGMSAQSTDIRHIDVEGAGLYDYALNLFKPAIQIDFNRHRLFNVKVQDNHDSGIGIFWNDVFSEPDRLEISNSMVRRNAHHGISIHSQGLSVFNCHIEQNGESGIHYEPMVDRWELMDLRSWITSTDSKFFRTLPDNGSIISLDPLVSDHMLVRVFPNPSSGSRFTFEVKTKETYAIGVMILNPVFEAYTDKLIMYNKNHPDAPKYNLRVNSSAYPLWTYSFETAFDYNAGVNPKGNIILYFVVKKISFDGSLYHDLTAQQDYKNHKIKTTLIRENLFRGNRHSFSSNHYNRDIGLDGNFYHRHSNETILMINNNFLENNQEAIFIDSPHYDPGNYALAEINYTLINNKFQGNGGVILHRDLNQFSSNNLFHWTLNNTVFEGNKNGGFIIRLPYVWQYNENYTHTINIHNNTFSGNRNFEFIVDGHYADFNMSRNTFNENTCRSGLISITGMEKAMLIQHNSFTNNVGRYIVEFNVDSHTDKFGLVRAYFRHNRLLDNQDQRKSRSLDHHNPASYTLALRGVQYINITRNLIRNPSLHFEFIAPVLTGSLDNRINLTENWWGTANSTRIRERIFDFDDWNSYAIANFDPLLISENFDAAAIKADVREEIIDLNRPFGGRLHQSLRLRKRNEPYIISTDLTILPGTNLTIDAGVEIEFYPSVGILVLGDLVAYGNRRDWITMRPVNAFRDVLYVSSSSISSPVPMSLSSLAPSKPLISSDRIMKRDRYSASNSFQRATTERIKVRLCITEPCEESKSVSNNHGFLEIFNRTTNQWVPICDERFSERNVQVVCGQLGYSKLNFHLKRGPRINMGPTYTSKVRHWPNSLQCSGMEDSLSECEEQINGYHHVGSKPCTLDSDQFVYIYCGPRDQESENSYWGGIRFAIRSFERDSDSGFSLQDRSYYAPRSRLQYVNIYNAGISHGEKNPAIQIIQRDVSLEFVTVKNSAHHAIEAIAPEKHVILHHLHLANNLGAGLNFLALTGASTVFHNLPYILLKESTLPYNVFSFVDICDINKNLVINQRILMYFKYDSRAVDCVKIIKSSVKSKRIGFRLLQFNLFNSTAHTAQPDFIRLYDGDIFNQTVKMLAEIGVTESHRQEGAEKQYYTSTENTLSIRLHASGGSEVYGFIAEVTTSPISYFVDRGLFHNLTQSLIVNNSLGGLIYQSAGETSPSVAIHRSHFESNCLELYGNFTSCLSAAYLHLQNTPHFYFYNNLVKDNDGGLRIKVNALSAAAAIHANVVNNLFVDNHKREALHISGPNSGAYQIVLIKRNYFNHNYSPYRNNIYLSKVVFNFTENIMVRNYGRHQLAVIGFDISFSHQTIHRNWLYNNLASHWEEKSTVFATNSGQRYYHNYLVNPENNFEMATVNQSQFLIDYSRSLVDASENWWGFNETSAVTGRIRDANDSRDLLSVRFMPYLTSNTTVLSGICSGGWQKIGDTCFLYFGARLTYSEAKHFCELQNSTMPVVKTHFHELTHYLYQWEETYSKFYHPVWIQSLGFLEKDCNVLLDEKIESFDCNQRLPFFCERAPLIRVRFSLPYGPFSIAILSIATLTAILTLLCLLCWTCKSRERHKEKLERHNSIRASIRSNRSLASSASLNENAYRRQIEKAIMMARQNHSQENSSSLMVDRSGGLTNSSFKANTNDSYDSLNKNNVHYNDSDAGSEEAGYTSHQVRNSVFRQLEDRFAKDPALENANVDCLVRPTFDYTIQNANFKETPSVSRTSADLSKEYPFNTGDSSPVNTISTMDTKRTEGSASPSPSLTYRTISSPHHYEEYTGGKSPTPSFGLPPVKPIEFRSNQQPSFTVHNNHTQSDRYNHNNHTSHQRPQQPPPQPPTHKHSDSFTFNDSSSLTGGVQNETITSLTEQRPYLETCLDADNNYDYFQFHSNRYSSTASITTASTNRSRPPLETAM
ncbi:C-type lectin domain-containing protein bark beetle [Brevipalpus obovatus]|uniref:C-type lectin domain-containing protein bark beetle n=1 Tax=Brevipalpus obovatus TaxID=246614 RepID=UPI003D9F75CD